MKKEQHEVRECLPSFGAECFVFELIIQKYKEQIQKLILPVVLYGCGICSLTLREKRRLRVLRIGC
jgi:hypothetical protein